MRIIRQVILISFMFICLGSNLIKAHALTTETIYATNNNCTFSDSGKYKNVSSNGTISTNTINTVYQGKSYGMQFYFAEDMLTTKVYQLKITFMADDLLSRVNTNFISLKTFDTSCEQDYATILSIEKNTNSGNATTLLVNFIPAMTSNKAVILIGSESGPTQITGETNFGIKKVEIGDRESQGNEDIIINNNQNTQNIINNENQNTQNIIDNQNQNTQDLIDSNKACSSYDKSNIKTDNYYLYGGIEQTETPGTELSSTSWGITDYIAIDKDSDIYTMQTFTGYTFAGLCFYNTNKTLISCLNTTNTSSTLTIPTDSAYVRFSINKSQNKPQFKVCRNGNQAISDGLNDLNSNLTNDSPIDVSSLGNTVGWLPPGPIDAIINLPLNMLNGLLTAFNKTCSPLSVPVPYLSQNITIPCLSTIFAKINGLTNFWSWVGLIASVVILYKYLIALYDYYDHLTTLQANYLSDFGGAP